MNRPAAKLSLSDTVLYRVPQFHWDATLPECWEELKQSISNSSPAFYSEIADCTAEEITGLPQAVQHTIWKYFNRARYRATPYGSFAAIGLGRLSVNPDQPATLSGCQQLHLFNDWSEAIAKAPEWAEIVRQNAKLFTNSTWYLGGDAIRYVSKGADGYELSELPANEWTIAILESCRTPKTVQELVNAHSVGTDLLASMVDDQLLISSLSPNIIGEDYFERQGCKKKDATNAYVIAERTLNCGEFDKRLFRQVPKLVTRLHQLLPSYSSPELDSFASRFRDKFGEAEIPLMMALDPETGVGFGNMEQDSLTSELMEKLSVSEQAGQHSGHSTLTLLLKKLLEQPGKVIHLEEIPLPDSLINEPLPNTIPVLLSSYGGLLILEHAGGVTANALLGRFTLASDQIHNICRDFSSLEQRANPDVLFFDIGYLTGKQVDNVNRRKEIYEQQINLLAYDTSADPVSLSDLYVSVRGGEIYLRSTNKRMIPRLATAYNYMLSDLPAFRFFCDLQHQGIHKNLSFRLRERLPGQAYYPRLQYGNIILSPATWKISRQDVGNFDSTRLIHFLEQKAIAQWVRCGQGDRMLTMNLKDKRDLEALIVILKKEKELYLEEIPVEATGMILDEEGLQYGSQYMLTLCHSENIYRDMERTGLYKEWKKEPVILPGGKWLYVEIFCHRSRMDELLTGPVASLLNRHHDAIRSWFFIRYTKNGPHLRVRFRLHSPEDNFRITAHLMSSLQPYVDAGLVSDIAIKPYQREINRYGSDHMEATEVYFDKDSSYVLKIIDQQADDEWKYQSCLSLLEAIKFTGVIPANDFDHMLAHNAKAFNQEFSLDAKAFKAINTYESNRLVESTTGHIYPVKELADACIQLLSSHHSIHRIAVLSSLIHMHINRLFNSSQRLHEAVIYNIAARRVKAHSHQIAIS